MTYSKKDPDTIRSMFNSIATTYDKTNAVLSLNMHKRWNAALIREVIVPANPKVLLDLCCGTGAISLEYLRKVNSPIKAYLLDFSEGMLTHAKHQSAKMPLTHHDISFLQADAQQIPLLNNQVDCAVIAYGIRNIKNPQQCIQDAYRVLQPGGTLGILELTQPENPLLRFGHHLYLRTMLPLLGKCLSSNGEAYQYLCKSIPEFIHPKELQRLMSEVGFQTIQRKSLSGGIATLVIGKK